MDISYQVIRSRRKTVALQILPDGTVVVRCPMGMSRQQADAFVRSKSHWLQTHLSRRQNQTPMPILTDQQLQGLAQEAMEQIPPKVAAYAQQLSVTYGRITIRNQRTRWGSCSSKGNLNFNCLLMLMPEEVRDDVIVHELCHRKEMNHSAAFWKQVEAVLPDYRETRKWLKEHGNAFLTRLPQK